MLKKTLIFLMLTLSLATSFAQTGDSDITGDDAYDPFADYSEFEASADEEADIHFFKNGRFFNLALLLGPQMFTESLGEYHNIAPAYGIYFAYFFDIRTALQVTYISSTHDFNVPATATSNPINGTTSLSTFSVHMKYYFNTQNITRGFADLNPYLIGGFGSSQRSIAIVNQTAVAKNSPTGVEFGGGLEVPISRNKMYLGAQIMYHYVQFSDENMMLADENRNPTGVTLNGDYITGLFVLGINF
jgi:hypothetical protein